jgi:Rrf2 family iron-sulfur cluster assembly transcriptional regulator
VLRISKKALLALEAVVDIAFHARPEPVQSREITERQGIPQRYLEQVMQHLVRAGILRGVRGPRGGYRLARERRRISVGEIVRTVGALEGPEDNPDQGSDIGHKVVRPMIKRIEDNVMAKLDAITIEDLCKQAESAGCVLDRRQRMDFTI